MSFGRSHKHASMAATRARSLPCCPSRQSLSPLSLPLPCPCGMLMVSLRAAGAREPGAGIPLVRARGCGRCGWILGQGSITWRRGAAPSSCIVRVVVLLQNTVNMRCVFWLPLGAGPICRQMSLPPPAGRYGETVSAQRAASPWCRLALLTLAHAASWS